MSRKNIIIVTAAFLGVVAVYFYEYRDWFRKPHIQIAHTFRPMGWTRRQAPEDNDNVVMFRLDHAYKITSLKIVPATELETNKFAHSVWELASDSNSVPTQAFAYGMGIGGMHPANKDAQAETLKPNVPYRLLVKAGSLNGEHDFVLTEDNHVGQDQ